jgi:hypothetical protein
MMDTSNISPLIKASLELAGNSAGTHEYGTTTGKKEGVEIAHINKLDSSALIQKGQSIEESDTKVNLRKLSKDRNNFESQYAKLA